jgi:hypothetical protein
MGFGEESPRLAQAQIGLTDVPKSFLAGCQWEVCSSSTFDHCDGQSGIMHDGFVNDPFGGNEFVGNGLSGFVALI